MWKNILAYLFYALNINSGLCEPSSNQSFCEENAFFAMVSDNATLITVDEGKKTDGWLDCILPNSLTSNHTHCSSLGDEKVFFYLYTKQNPTKRQVLQTGDRQVLENSYFNKSNPTLMIFHGWMSHVYGTRVYVIIRAARKHYKYNANVIAVDWSEDFKNPLYFAATKYLEYVAKWCRDFLIFLIECGANRESIHLVGYNLGGQVAAYTAELMSEKHKIGRLTGLDPTVPIVCDDVWEEVLVKSRFNRSLASFVDIIHTSPYGIRYPVAHADFYPDGGLRQECCAQWADDSLMCSHTIACRYFRDSLYTDEFVGTKCKSFNDLQNNRTCNGAKAIMGINAPTSVRGVFYVSMCIKKSILPRSSGCDICVVRSDKKILLALLLLILSNVCSNYTFPFLN